MNYAAFIERKAQLNELHGFEPSSLPSFLFDFQRDLVLWALRKGRSAIFADCGPRKHKETDRWNLTRTLQPSLISIAS